MRLSQNKKRKVRKMISSLDDPSADVRMSAALELREFFSGRLHFDARNKDDSVRPWLDAIWEDDELQLVETAIESLLERGLEDPSKEVRFTAINSAMGSKYLLDRHGKNELYARIVGVSGQYLDEANSQAREPDKGILMAFFAFLAGMLLGFGA